MVHKFPHAKRGAQWPAAAAGQGEEGRLASATRDLHAFGQKELSTRSLEREDEARGRWRPDQHPGRARRVLKQEGEEGKGEGTGPAGARSPGAGRNPGRPARAQVSEPGWSAVQRVSGSGAHGRGSEPRPQPPSPPRSRRPEPWAARTAGSHSHCWGSCCWALTERVSAGLRARGAGWPGWPAGLRRGTRGAGEGARRVGAGAVLPRRPEGAGIPGAARLRGAPPTAQGPCLPGFRATSIWTQAGARGKVPGPGERRSRGGAPRGSRKREEERAEAAPGDLGTCPRWRAARPGPFPRSPWAPEQAARGGNDPRAHPLPPRLGPRGGARQQSLGASNATGSPLPPPSRSAVAALKFRRITRAGKRQVEGPEGPPAPAPFARGRSAWAWTAEGLRELRAAPRGRGRHVPAVCAWEGVPRGRWRRERSK